MAAMFNKNQGEENNYNETETIIGSSVKIEGNFNSEGNIIVEGEVDGTLKTNKDLDVKKGAKITASVEAANMKIAGEIEGNVKCHNSLEITGSGKITGDIEADVLSVTKGATIKGQVNIEGSNGVVGTEEDIEEIEE